MYLQHGELGSLSYTHTVKASLISVAFIRTERLGK